MKILLMTLILIQGGSSRSSIRVLSLPPKDWADWLTWIATIALAVAGIIGVKYAYGTLKAIEDQTRSARISKEGMQAVERAYVAFPIMGAWIESVKNQLGNFQEWKIALPVKNTGHTPARDLIIKVNWHWRENELPDNFDFPDYEPSGKGRFDLPSGEQIYSPDLIIPHDIIRRTINKEIHLYYYGWATYQDVFEGTPERRTEFCHRVIVTGIDGDKLAGNREFHHSHNRHT